MITDAAGNVRTTVREPGHGRLDRPERHAHRPRRGRLGHRVAGRDHGRRRRAGRVRRLAGRWRHLDGDRIRHERAVRHAAETRAPSPTGSTTCARSATTRSATRRRTPSARTSGSTTPRRRSSPRTPADGSVSVSANQIVLTASEPVTRARRAARRRRSARPGHLRQRAHLRDRRARRRPAHALRRARGRERHPHAVPRRGHDREHAAAEPPAGREVGVPDVDDDPRGAGSARHGSDAGIGMADASSRSTGLPRSPRRSGAAVGRNGVEARTRQPGDRGHGALGARGHLRARLQRRARSAPAGHRRIVRRARHVAGRDDLADAPAPDRHDAALRQGRRLLPRRQPAFTSSRAISPTSPSSATCSPRRRRGRSQAWSPPMG